MDIKESKKECCGCTACYAVCPTGAVVMREDEEGFFYPWIDEEKCIHCDQCKNVCAFSADYREKLSVANRKSEQHYYVGRVKDRMIRDQSRSGGIFYALAREIQKRDGVVYGVVMDADCRAVYERAVKVEELHRMQGSKYVQAMKGDILHDIEKDLRNGKLVLAAGTACEIAGLLAYLQSHNVCLDQLYTVDLLCHGVPSPKIWQENIKDYEKRWKMQIGSADFRDKSFGWKAHIESYTGRTKTGKIRKKYSNKYTSLFYASVILRPSCHNCQFCNFDRPADLTLGDFWGAATTENPEIAIMGMSQIMANTNKGGKLLLELKDVEIMEASEEDISKQPNLFAPTGVSEDRSDFWKLYEEKGYHVASEKFYRVKERLKLPYNLLRRSNRR